MGVNVLACGQCGAGLPPPDIFGRSACVYCGAEHRSGRSNEILHAALADRPSWHDCVDATRIPLTDEAVLDLLRQHFVHADAAFVCPHVPPKKEFAVRRLHVMHLPAHERVLALYDAIGGTGHDGFVVTARRVCWKNPGEPAASIDWHELDPDHLAIEGRRLSVSNDEAIVIDDEDVRASAFDAFHVLALSGVPHPIHSERVLARYPERTSSVTVGRAAPDSAAPSSRSALARVPSRAAEPPPRRGGDPESTRVRTGKTEATPPPPHTTSYFTYATHAQMQRPDCSCWRCRTPLYETTPQCAFCGAVPAKTGWLRTG